MQNRQQFVDAYRAATEEESRLWKKVEGRGPGQAGHDPDLWRQWLEAVGRTNAASKALREAFSDRP